MAVSKLYGDTIEVDGVNGLVDIVDHNGSTMGLKLGGTLVTATAAELNQAADSSSNLEVVTTTNVITAAESGSIFVLNSATAFVSTLPSVAAGLKYKFIVGATIVTGGNHTIVPTDDNTIYGGALVAGGEIAASAEGSINLIADLTLPGDMLEVVCDGTNWYVDGHFVTTAALTFTT